MLERFERGAEANSDEVGIPRSARKIASDLS